jgi:hypothetical protein
LPLEADQELGGPQSVSWRLGVLRNSATYTSSDERGNDADRVEDREDAGQADEEHDRADDGERKATSQAAQGGVSPKMESQVGYA